MKNTYHWSSDFIPYNLRLIFRLRISKINGFRFYLILLHFSVFNVINFSNGDGSNNCSLADVDLNQHVEPPQFEVRLFKRNLTTGYLEVFHHDEHDVSYLMETVHGDEATVKMSVSVLADLNQRYDITCDAAYLTDLEVNFPVTRTDKLVRSRIVSDPFDCRTFIYRSLFYFYTKVGTSGSIICRSTEKKDIFTKIHIFTQAGNAFVNSGNIQIKKQNTQHITLTNNNRNKNRENEPLTVIPCPSNYAKLNPQLRKLSSKNNGNGTFEVVQAIYDPKKGFSLMTGEAEAGEYKCIAEDDEVAIKYVSVGSDAGPDNDDSSINGKPHVFFPSENGKIFCIDDNDLPTQKQIASILCDSQPDCDLHQKCYDNIDNCTAVYLKGEACLANNCAVIDESHQNGAVICQSGANKKVEYYFTGFDKRRYKISESNIPRRAQIYMDKVESVLYTDQETFFFCEAISFTFTTDIQFAAVMQNGSRIALFERESYRLATPEEMEPKISRGTVQKGIAMNVTENMTEIVCMVPWYNSSEWLTTSTKFLTKKPLPAVTKKVYTEKVFYVGEFERTLTCSADGEPIPTFQWFLNGQQITKEHSAFSISDAMDGKSTLRFPVVTHNVSGKYTCLASNRLGNDAFTLTLYAKDTGLTTTEIIGLVIGTGMLLGIISFGFFVVLRKYILTKKKLRKLTSHELEEFENGNPEALSLDINGDLHQQAQYLPFNKHYEIKDPDLVIDRKGVLGKGAYGVVLRGRYLGDPVAVKTTLPSADVMYFKALMAEVKIMAYIGHHKNLVTFVGAVTSNIRERMLYIVVELSPFGNLEKYLKSHRSTFINFIDGNDIVQPEYTYMNVLKRVSSLDLINWCGHIASGMEYLASKRVIHGDLATRNVLLFPGDVAKITDFGLSRQLYEHTNYVKKQQAPLPWRWMAIESLRDFEFSTESDVWAYGVTVWEIFTLAEIPYPGYTFSMDIIEKLEAGLRMNKPKYSSNEIFENILNCWNPRPQDRPSFEKLHEFFSAIWYKYSDSARASFGTGRHGVCLFPNERDR